MNEKDNLTARHLRNLLEDRWPDLKVSLSTIKRARRQLGWVATSPKYCQLVREANREKRVAWCRERISKGDNFSDVIFPNSSKLRCLSHSIW